MRVLILTLLILRSCLVVVPSEDTDSDHAHENDPFEEILKVFNISESEFTATPLQSLVEHFAERFECSRGQGLPQPTCQLSFCLNASNLLESLGVGSSEVITEEVFENISLTLLSLASDINKTCHEHVNLTPQTITEIQGKFIQHLGNYISTSVMAVTDLQLFLESLPLTDHEEEHGDHADEHDEEHEHDEEEGHNEETGHDTDHMEHAEDEHDEDGHVELFMDKCLGADVVYYQLQLELNQGLPTDEYGHMYMILVYHLFAGSPVSRTCRVLPRKEFFLQSVFRDHGGVNGTLSKEAFVEVLHELEIGKPQNEESDVTHDDHGHRRKRRSVSQGDFTFQESWDGTCYSGDELLMIYDIDHDVSMNQFVDLCPALIQQKLSKACSSPATAGEEAEQKEPTLSQRYGYGTIATFIICVSSAIGAVFVRCGSALSQNRLMNLFIGLAVGTLFGDALIHLLPEALGLHGHGDEDAHAHSDEGGIHVEPYVWYALVTCGGLYLFYLIELCSAFLPCCKVDHSHHNHTNSTQDLELSDVKVSMREDKYQVNKTQSTESVNDSIESNSLTCGLAPVAYMILIGDGIHNFVDGLAIGASFSTSVTLGISTSIAVLCHEVPHELGDFAILLKSGLSFWRALMLNFLSALTAMIGFYVGVAIVTNEDAERWVAAAVAGMFIYIALVSMLPTMLKEARSGVCNIILGNIGILIGVAIMLLLAVFEEKIENQYSEADDNKAVKG